MDVIEVGHEDAVIGTHVAVERAGCTRIQIGVDLWMEVTEPDTRNPD